MREFLVAHYCPGDCIGGSSAAYYDYRRIIAYNLEEALDKYSAQFDANTNPAVIGEIIDNIVQIPVEHFVYQ